MRLGGVRPPFVSNPLEDRLRQEWRHSPARTEGRFDAASWVGGMLVEAWGQLVPPDLLPGAPTVAYPGPDEPQRDILCLSGLRPGESCSLRIFGPRMAFYYVQGDLRHIGSSGSMRELLSHFCLWYAERRREEEASGR